MKVKPYQVVLPLCGLILVESRLIKTLIFIFLINYYFKQKIGLMILITLYLMLVTSNTQLENPIYEGRVTDIKEHYIIVENGKTKVLVQNIDTVNFDDWIRFEGKHRLIQQPPSRFQFNFKKYMQHQSVYYQVKASNFDIVKSSSTIRGHVHRALKKHPDSILLSKMIFNINNDEINLNDLLYSSGTTIRMVIFLLVSLISLFFYEKTVFFIHLILIILSFQINRDFYLFLRLLMIFIFKQTNLTRSTQTASCFLILIVMNYHLIFQQGFIIYFIIAFIRSIYTKNNRVLIPAVLIPIQLYFQFKINLCDLLMFRCLSYMNALLFLSALCDALFKTRMCLVLFNIRRMFPAFSYTITGHMNLVIVLVWIYFLMKYLSTQKNICLVWLFVILIFNQNKMYFNPFLTLTQLYIGQGDAAVIKMPFKKEVLFLDVGPASGYKKIEGYLNYHGIKKYRAIISHGDEDHCGALKSLRRNFIQKEVIEQHIDHYDYFKLRFLQLNEPIYDNDNDNSLVLLFKINEYQFLYTGDIGSEVEKNILRKYDDLNYNILKLAHHGSKHSNSMQLLEKENLKLIINSSGQNNLYHHPSQEVLQRIIKVGTPVLDTQDVGDISFLFLKRISLIKLEV